MACDYAQLSRDYCAPEKERNKSKNKYEVQMRKRLAQNEMKMQGVWGHKNRARTAGMMMQSDVKTSQTP